MVFADIYSMSRKSPVEIKGDSIVFAGCRESGDFVEGRAISQMSEVEDNAFLRPSIRKNPTQPTNVRARNKIPPVSDA